MKTISLRRESQGLLIAKYIALTRDWSIFIGAYAEKKTAV